MLLAKRSLADLNRIVENSRREAMRFQVGSLECCRRSLGRSLAQRVDRLAVYLAPKVNSAQAPLAQLLGRAIEVPSGHRAQDGQLHTASPMLIRHAELRF